MIARLTQTERLLALGLAVILAILGLTMAALGRHDHHIAHRSGLHSREIDEAVRLADLERRVVTAVNGFSAALALARETDLVATVPDRLTAGLRRGLSSFPLPVGVAPSPSRCSGIRAGA